MFFFCAKLGPICEKYLLNSNAIVALTLACLPLIVKISGYPLVAAFFVNILLIFNQVFFIISIFCKTGTIKKIWLYEYYDLGLYYMYVN